MNSTIPLEFINSLMPNGMPSHKLSLEKECNSYSIKKFDPK